MDDKYLDIMSVGLLPVYQYSKFLERTDFKEFEKFISLLEDNNSPSVFSSFLEFKEKMDGEKSKDIAHDLFLCDL